MKKSKKALAFLMAAMMCVTLLGIGTSALAGTGGFNYIQNWTSGSGGNGPGNNSSGTYSGTTNVNGQGSVTFTLSTNYNNTNQGKIITSWTTSPANSGFNNLQGVGWNPGSASKIIEYNAGVFSIGGSGCAYIAYYGWTRNSLIEYYVNQSWINYVNTQSGSGATQVKTGVGSDNVTYSTYYKNTSGPNIDGNGSFKQVMATPGSSLSIGTNRKITFQNIYNAWAADNNTKLGSSWSYAVLVVEGYNSSGQANVTVW